MTAFEYQLFDCPAVTSGTQFNEEKNTLPPLKLFS